MPEYRKRTLEQLLIAVAAECSDGLRLVQNLSDNPICTVVVDEAIPCVVVSWRRYVTSTQLRFIHEAILDLVRSRGLSRILGDDTALPTIHGADRRWIVEDWMPRAKAAGIRAAASKSPANYSGRFAVNQIGDRAPWPHYVFDDMCEARRWLQGTVSENP